MYTQLHLVTKKALDAFVAEANRQALHQYDWGRFYRFVREAHNNHDDLTPSDLKQHLQGLGFDGERSEELARVYHHGCLILRTDPPYLQGTET